MLLGNSGGQLLTVPERMKLLGQAEMVYKYLVVKVKSDDIKNNIAAYIITDYMGIRNESFMKLAAVGTWMGDFVTAWMVTDMMLQDKPYPDWGKSARAFWKKGNVRIILFWTVLFTLTSVVVLVITTDWISWDKLNRGFLPSDEVSRAFLASFILVFDLLIVMQRHRKSPEQRLHC
nr:transmembrane protein 117-like [Odocoileus virginianus texanus]